MSLLLASPELHQLIDHGIIDAPHEHVNASSIDVTLGAEFFTEVENGQATVYSDHPGDKIWNRHQSSTYILMRPRQFILGHLNEVFHLPDNLSAQFSLRSTMGRLGLEHLLAGWIDAGFNGDLTLELLNVAHNNLALAVGSRIGQVVFFRHSDSGEDSYLKKGRYRGQTGVTPAR